MQVLLLSSNSLKKHPYLLGYQQPSADDPCSGGINLLQQVEMEGKVEKTYLQRCQMHPHTKARIIPLPKEQLL